MYSHNKAKTKKHYLQIKVLLEVYFSRKVFSTLPTDRKLYFQNRIYTRFKCFTHSLQSTNPFINLQVKDVSHTNFTVPGFNKYILFTKQFHALFYSRMFFSTIMRPIRPPKLLCVDFYCRLVFLGINDVHSLFNLASQLLDKEIEKLREKNVKKNGSFGPAIVVVAA